MRLLWTGFDGADKLFDTPHTLQRSDMVYEKRDLTGNTACMKEAHCDTIGDLLMHQLPFSAERIVEEGARFDTTRHF